MSLQEYNYFVAAALIAAKLDQATKVAEQLSLTASNARAVALRAGERASGFRPLTDYIDRLAHITVKSSNRINNLAANLSKTATENFRSELAISRFDAVYKKAKGSPFINSLDFGYNRTKNHQSKLMLSFKQQINALNNELTDLDNELRTAVVLATLSRIEASQAGSGYQDSLNNVADNVSSSADLIKSFIKSSKKLAEPLQIGTYENLYNL